MLTQTQQQILTLLIEHQDSDFSIRQIARSLGKSYTLTYHNIQKLCDMDIIKKAPVPPAQIIRIQEENSTNILIDIERQRASKFFEKNKEIALYAQDVLKAAPHPFFAMLIFGSYAKGTQTKKSDLDLLIITPRNEDIAAIEAATRQPTKTKKNIIVVTSEDFLGMIRNEKSFNVGNESRKHHIIIHNAESYYQLLRRDT